MNRSRKTSLAFVLLVAGLLMTLGAAPALASPQGDEDPTFNGQGAAFNIAELQFFNMACCTRPLTTQDPNDGTVIAATVLVSEGHVIHIARFTKGGEATTYGGGGDVDIPAGRVDDLLDVRVLPSGDIYVLYRWERNDDPQNPQDPTLGWVRSNRDGTVTESGDAIQPSEDCDSPYVDAAKVEADGNFVSLWDCQEQVNPDQVQAQAFIPSTRVVRNKPDVHPGLGNTQLANKQVDALEAGQDVELDPRDNGHVYVLGHTAEMSNPVALATGSPSGVVHFTTSGEDLSVDNTYGTSGVRTLQGKGIDLAVDYSGRAIVWTDGDDSGGTEPWVIFRLTEGGALDTGWSGDGKAELVNANLGDPEFSDYAMVLARRDGKVMAIGPTADGDTEIIARLTSAGVIDPSWATAGYKLLEFTNGDDKHIFFGNIALQSDKKTLVAFHSQTGFDDESLSTRRFGDPGDHDILGVGRLDRSSSSSKPNPSTPDQGGVAGTSAKGSICGRRAISLVRAFSRGRKVELQGLVGAAYYGKRVTIYASSGHGFRKVKTTKATRIGTFKTKVRRPRGRRFITTRYIAKAGKSKSPVLKLPQSLKSTSVKERAGKITVKGHVKRALLGSRRNKVKIQRLVCGHYKTLGSARPTRSGKYVVTFNKPVLGGVAYFRARGVVLNKPGGHKYVVQYARAIRIKLTGQTG